MLVFSRDPVPFTFRQDTTSPKTVWWIRPLTDKDWAIVQAQIKRNEGFATQTGRSEADAETIGRGKDMEFHAMASSVDRIENYGDEGTIADKDRIFEILNTMSYSCYQELGGFVLTTAAPGVLEGNSSGSLSEQSKKQASSKSQEPTTSTTAESAEE